VPRGSCCLIPGDQDSAATAVNDLGQVVGISGTCDVAIGAFSAKHAVLWENGMVVDIGNPKGAGWNTPTVINNRGQIGEISSDGGKTWKGWFDLVFRKHHA
jgi:probable HAF family extracellular repeat protein